MCSIINHVSLTGNIKFIPHYLHSIDGSNIIHFHKSVYAVYKQKYNFFWEAHDL